MEPEKSYSIREVYGVYAYIYHKNPPNVGKYTIHRSYGMDWCWFSSIIPRRPCKLPPKTGWSFSPRICAMPLKNGPCKVVCFGSQVEGVYTNLCYREATIFWLVVSNIFYVQPELLGRWTHFDEHIFQRGWNHQLYSFNYSPGVNWPVLSKKSVGKMSFWNPIGWDILVSWGVTKSIQIKSYMIIYIYMYIYICIYIYVCAAAQPQQDSSFGMCVCVFSGIALHDWFLWKQSSNCYFLVRNG